MSSSFIQTGSLEPTHQQMKVQESHSKHKRPYLKIEDERRLKLLKMVKEDRMSLKEASERLNINYYSAKTVMLTYRKKGRINRKLTRDRRKKVIEQTPTDISPQGLTDIPKRIFNIEKIKLERSTALASNEGSDQLPSFLKPSFSFDGYTKNIEDEYKEHFRIKLKDIKHLEERMLPVPILSDNTNAKNE